MQFKIELSCEFGISRQYKGIFCKLIIPEHMYECRAPDEEAEDLICTACYPDGENGLYSCSCWVSQEPEVVEERYLTCQDALDKGQHKSGVYTLKPDHLPAFQVKEILTFESVANNIST